MEVLWNENWVTFLDVLMKVQMFVDNDKNVKNVLPARLRRLEVSALQISCLKRGSIFVLLHGQKISSNLTKAQ